MVIHASFTWQVGVKADPPPQQLVGMKVDTDPGTGSQEQCVEVGKMVEGGQHFLMYPNKAFSECLSIIFYLYL